MVAEPWCFVRGQRVTQPLMPHDARDRGWHKGADYNAFDITDDFPYDEFKAWCKETFEFGTYVIFIRNAWFLRESDAALCRLKWA